jgi:GTP-binding protein EngB required for normal cell division
MSERKNNMQMEDLPISPTVPDIIGQLDLRPVINVAVFGCVSVGKSTFLNMMMTRTFSDCHIKRTTIMPQIYYELTQFEQDSLDLNDESSRELSDLEQIRSLNSDRNSNQMKEQAKSGISIKLEDIKPSEYVVPAIKGFAKLQSDKHGNGVTLAIHDMPGLNDAISRDVYFEYVQQNFSQYDVAIIILDIQSSLNTSDEVAILDLILNGIKANESKMVCTKLMVLMNKCDSLDITQEKDPVPEDEELQEMLDQAQAIIAVRCKELEVNIDLQVSCISCEDAFVYRMIKDERFDELDIKYINRIGQLEFPARQWKKFSEVEKRKKVSELVAEEGAAEGLKMTGFYAFRKKFEKLMDKKTQYELCFNRINNTLLCDLTHPGNTLDITVDLKWFHRIKVVICNTNRIFKKKLFTKFEVFDSMFETFLQSHLTFAIDELKSIQDIEILKGLKTTLYNWEDKLNLGKYECVKLISDCVVSRMKELGAERLGNMSLNLYELADIIKTLTENEIDSKEEILKMMGSIYKYDHSFKDESDNMSPIYYFIMSIPEETGITQNDRYKALVQASFEYIYEMTAAQRLTLGRIASSYQVDSMHRYWYILQIFKLDTRLAKFTDADLMGEIDSDIIGNTHKMRESLLGLFMAEVFK